MSLLFEVRPMFKINPVQILFDYMLLILRRNYSILKGIFLVKSVRHKLTIEIVDVDLRQT